jgi:hypothetical protein
MRAVSRKQPARRRDLAHRKAHALVEALQTGGNVSDNAQQFDKAFADALADFSAARAEIVAAKLAVDNT